jgi:hypothetical protein
MKAIQAFVKVLVCGLILSGCSRRPTEFEATASVGFYHQTVDLKWEVGFVRAERFLWEVFQRLTKFDLAVLAPNGESDERELFRLFVHQASAQPVEKSHRIEVHFLHENAVFAANMANRIAQLFVGVRGGEAYLIEPAFPPKKPAD